MTGVVAEWTCAGCGKVGRVDEHDHVGTNFRAVFPPRGWYVVEQAEVHAVVDGELCTRRESHSVCCGDAKCVVVIQGRLRDMNARELTTQAAAARAAYIEAAEKVARGDRDADASALPALAAVAAQAEQDARVQTMRETWSAWTPAHAPHVTGKWTQRVFDSDGMPEEQRVVIDCKVCGAHYERGCTSGLVQSHIQRFSFVHLHRDVFHVRPRKV